VSELGTAVLRCRPLRQPMLAHTDANIDQRFSRGAWCWVSGWGEAARDRPRLWEACGRIYKRRRRVALKNIIVMA
jgi:hypothetical protein